MKRWIRIIFILILLCAGGAMMFWYFFIRRTIPEHAKYIPKDAFAIVTLNTKALAIDHSSGGHLYPEFEKIAPLPGELAKFLKAVERNGGSGVRESSDVLAFAFRKNSSAFGAVCTQLTDSGTFGKLVRNEISKTLFTRSIVSGNEQFICFDTTHSLVLGWNADAAIVLFAISDEDANVTAQMCSSLLDQNAASSILQNENFCAHELSSFDVGVWMQAQPLLEFTGGGKYFRNLFYDVKYLSLAIDLNKGEIAARKIVTRLTDIPETTFESQLSSNTDRLFGFAAFPLHLQNDSAIAITAAAYPLNELPFNNETAVEMCRTFDGSATVLLHDTFRSVSTFITYEYDDDFNQIPVQGKRQTLSLGTTISFGLKDVNKAKFLLETQMKKDSIEQKEGAYLIDQNGETYRLMIVDHSLIWTNWRATDGQLHNAPDQWSGKQFYFSPKSWLNSDASEFFSFIFPDPVAARTIFADQVVTVMLTQPISTGIKNSSEFRLQFRNRKINALIQVSEIGRKLLK